MYKRNYTGIIQVFCDPSGLYTFCKHHHGTVIHITLGTRDSYKATIMSRSSLLVYHPHSCEPLEAVPIELLTTNRHENSRLNKELSFNKTNKSSINLKINFIYSDCIQSILKAYFSIFLVQSNAISILVLKLRRHQNNISINYIMTIEKIITLKRFVLKENGINSFNINNHPNDVFILNKEKMVVYRIDSRPAGTIMVDGFKPRGNNHDISTFILNPPDDAGFISTSISNPDEMLAQYQLRGFVIEAALDFASKNKLNFEYVKDPPPLVDMPLDWAFNRFKGESTALVYKIMLNPDQGIDVEKSTFLNSDKGHVFNMLMLA